MAALLPPPSSALSVLWWHHHPHHHPRHHQCACHCSRTMPSRLGRPRCCHTCLRVKKEYEGNINDTGAINHRLSCMHECILICMNLPMYILMHLKMYLHT